eukprot:CAMPEP_0114990750 /NCGR_PEP_ID=MMETSP0216-20121206/10980_1 /TAXON_ID=223996 /ORGANISM="Protocruzia adherens, Strain Boccale" /LENGTH=173 /DNA_ID=CAMNT_0002353981 /DNA_START=251 /DNA_END=772 /DNA_ORIENTATION=+
MDAKDSTTANVDKFGRPLPNQKDAQGYLCPSLTTDAAVIRKHKEDDYHDILMITRGRNPFQGKLAFPGGFVDYNEAPEVGCARELEEECSLKGTNPRLVSVRGDPQRDPRKHVVTICYRIDVPEDAEPKAGDDAATAKFYSLKDLLTRKDDFAFDHFELLQQVIATLDTDYGQ